MADLLGGLVRRRPAPPAPADPAAAAAPVAAPPRPLVGLSICRLPQVLDDHFGPALVEAPTAPDEECIVCHRVFNTQDGDSDVPACVALQMPFCRHKIGSECYSQLLSRGYRGCPLCRMPLADTDCSEGLRKLVEAARLRKAVLGGLHYADQWYPQVLKEEFRTLSAKVFTKTATVGDARRLWMHYATQILLSKVIRRAGTSAMVLSLRFFLQPFLGESPVKWLSVIISACLSGQFIYNLMDNEATLSWLISHLWFIDIPFIARVQFWALPAVELLDFAEKITLIYQVIKLGVREDN